MKSHTDIHNPQMQPVSYQSRLQAIPKRSRLKYQLRAWRLADVEEIGFTLFEPLLLHVFETGNMHTAMALACTNTILCEMVKLLLTQFGRRNEKRCSCRYAFEVGCTRKHVALPELPTRGAWCTAFGACACCGATGSSAGAHGRGVNSLCYNLRTGVSYVAPLCRVCIAREWICGFGDEFIATIPYACACAYSCIYNTLKHRVFKAKFIAEQVFEHAVTKQVKRFTQFSLQRSDGCKMVVALETHIFERCVGVPAHVHQLRDVLDIHTVLVNGINLSLKRPSMRLPGSVFYAFINDPNDGFCNRVKRECYHSYKISVDDTNSQRCWVLLDCSPCWQRHKYGGCASVCRCGHPG